MVSPRLIIVVIGTVVLHFFIALAFMMCRTSKEEQFHQEKLTLEKEWNAEDEQRESEQEAYLQKKLGTNKFDRIAYDPRLDIRLVLEKLFVAVTPETYQVEVSVDRFTEFTVIVKAPQIPEKVELARFLKEVFSRVDPRFVYQVIFMDASKKNCVLVSGGDLIKINDWKQASPSLIIRKCL